MRKYLKLKGAPMNEECLICKESLSYLETATEMQCELCGKTEHSKTACIKGHYVCDECHTKGMDAIIGICLAETSRDPINILNTLMREDFCHMHGPEHHVLVGASLLTAYKNAGGEIDLLPALKEMLRRGKQVPGGACGFWGACGAGVSTGMYISIISGASPLTEIPWGLANRMTAKALEAIGNVGGPRCCKRDSYLAILQAIDFTKEHFGIEMESSGIICGFSSQNNQCISKRCPFSSQHHKPKKKVAFLCVHNSCRSQIAEALGKHLASDVFESYSAGSELKPRINPDAVRLMKQIYGIDMEKNQHSKLFADIPMPDLVISMGCNVGCPYIGRAFDDNWNLPDPTGESDAVFEEVIRAIEGKIMELKERIEGI